MPTYTKDELEKKLKAKGAKRVTYLGIGRTIAVIAGSMQMVDTINIQPMLRNAERGDWAGVASRLKSLFMNPSFKKRAEGAGIMAVGIGAGKVLDKYKTNPKIEIIGGWGLKLW